jgi:hypothetical protein
MPDTTAAILVIALSLAVFGLLAVGAFFVARDTIRQRGRWGICLTKPKCLKCGEPAPLVRMPASWNQTLWGGWTCTQCGFELDKFGNPVEEQPFPAKWSAKLDDEPAPAKNEKSDARLRKPSEDARPGGDIRG